MGPEVISILDTRDSVVGTYWAITLYNYINSQSQSYEKQPIQEWLHMMVDPLTTMIFHPRIGNLTLY